jgi:uncharacterized tellurite resistance protein B-like protein
MSRTAEDLGLEELKLAYLQDMLGRIAGADGVIVAPEKDMIDAICPPEALQKAGLADADGKATALAESATVRAMMVLPGALSQEERLQLVTPLAALCAVDGSVDLREKSYVAMAGYLLGLSIPVLSAHLAGTGVTIAVQ